MTYDKSKYNMKVRISATAVAASAALIVLGSCKTTEANYREAYETARQTQYTGVDSTVYAKIRQEAIPSTITADGDSIHMKTEFVTATKAKDGSAPQIMRYGVVVGQFKQVFNARAMLGRLAGNGYPDAYIVENREPLYYVIATGNNDLKQAAVDLKKISSDKNLSLRPPLPWILQSATHRR